MTMGQVIARNPAVAREAIKRCLFDAGVSGWILKEGRYHRVVAMRDYPNMGQLISHFSAGVPAVLQEIGLNDTEFQFEIGTRTAIEVSVEQAAFDATIKPKLNFASAGDLGSNVAVFQPRNR